MSEKSKLMDAEELLKTQFTAESRPSKRTLWNWVALGLIPAVRVGRSVFFDPAAVESSLFGSSRGSTKRMARPKMLHRERRLEPQSA